MVIGNSRERRVLNLQSGWFVRKLDSDNPDIPALAGELESPGPEWMAANMPAQVHEILLANGKISDPHVGRNAAECVWVGESDWAYGVRFESPAEVDSPVFLKCEGVDTLAKAYLNGKLIGSFDDMYLAHSVEVSSYLATAGDMNTLIFVFSSPARFLREYERPENAPDMPNYHYLRKCHSDYGSYLGAYPHSLKVGIYRDVLLDIPVQTWIDDVWVRTKLAADFGSAQVSVNLELRGDAGVVDWALHGPDGEVVASGSANCTSGCNEISIPIDHPQLWWPRTHGPQNLYCLNIEVKANGELLDTRTVSFGIRDVKAVLTDPQTGEKRFRFDINGMPIFMRGANWAPIEGMTHVWDSDRSRRLLDLIEHGDMNMLRIWGEGHIPPQEFYDECDRRGILIWQDFMFGYDMHPTGWPEFDEKCRIEVEDEIIRLRNHPCILLWCGGNENYMGYDFAHRAWPTRGNELFKEIMPKACAKLDPDRLFQPSSPFGGSAPNWPLEGDWHDYTTIDFLPDASVPTFVSEMIRVSTPSLASMRKFMSPEDLWPEGYDPAVRTPGQIAWPPFWQYRSVVGAWEKIGPIENFCDPSSPEELIRVLGTAHGEYLRERVERERRGVPDGAPDGNRRCWGNLVWRLNDTWPIIYSSVIDYYVEPKIAYYFLRRAYQPVLVSFERTQDRICVWVVNDSQEAAAGTLTVRRMSLDGKCHAEISKDVEIKPGEARRCLDTIDFGPVSLRHDFLSASFAGLDATLLLTGERYLNLPQANLTVSQVDGGFEISTDKFARQVTVLAEGVTGAVFTDNFFDLAPGQTKRVEVLNSASAKQYKINALNSNEVIIGALG